MSERFAADWLALRRPADQRARDNGLAERLAGWCRSRRRLRLVDLGAGSGANAAFLGPRLPGAPAWQLVDHDAALLDAAVDTLPGAEAVVRDLRGGVGDLVAAADVVTAAALLDLVSAAWVDDLVDTATGSGAALLFALSFAGAAEWQPALPADRLVIEALNAHQRRDKGFGPALGPTAADYTAAACRRAGYRVTTRPSPWRLSAADAGLQSALLDGWRAAAAEQRPDRRQAVDAWGDQRCRLIEAGDSAVRVAHTCVLALPP